MFWPIFLLWMLTKLNCISLCLFVCAVAETFFFHDNGKKLQESDRLWNPKELDGLQSNFPPISAPPGGHPYQLFFTWIGKKGVKGRKMTPFCVNAPLMSHCVCPPFAPPKRGKKEKKGFWKKVRKPPPPPALHTCGFSFFFGAAAEEREVCKLKNTLFAPILAFCHYCLLSHSNKGWRKGRENYFFF